MKQTVQENKQDQKAKESNFPEIKPVKPTDDTAYIQPVIGKLGWDTRPDYKGLFGLGTSPDNGVNFHVFLTFDGLNFDADDIDNIWNNGTSDRVKKEVDSATAEIPDAIAKAQDAVNRANSAVANSKVNSDAIKAMESAAAEAKSGADQAIKDAQAAIKNVASDAAAIKQNVANVESQVASAQSANAAAVQQLNNDLSTAKQNIATANANLTKAQSAIDDNKKAIADSVAKINSDIANDRKDMDVTRTQLSSAQDAIAKNRKDLESNVADINSEIAQDRKGIAAAQQANADTAKQLGDYAKQAAAQGKTIKSLQDDDNSTKLTIADIKGNVSQVQDSVSGLSASLKDTQGNLATVKALADSLNATMTDHGKSIAALQATAQSLSSTLSDADGRLSKVEQTAKSQSTTLSTMQGNLSQVKQEADSLTANLKDTQGDIAKVQATAKGLSEQITTAQGAITALQTDVSGIKATIADHDKNIHTLQATAKSLTDSMADAQGNISKLQATAAGLTSKFTDQSGRLSKVEQTAAEHSTTISNLRSEVEWKQVSNSTLDTMKSAGHFWGTGKALTGKPGNIKDTDQVRVVVEAPSANSVSQTLYANGLVWQRSFDGKTWSKWVRSANQGDVDTLQGSITQVKQTAAGLTTTIHDAQNNIAQIQTTAKGLSQQIESAQGDIANLTKTATGLQASLADHSKRIATVEARADKLESDMKDAQGNITTAMQTASAASVTASDAKSNAATAVVTASGTKTAAEDAKSDAAEAQLTASAASVTAKDAKSDVMTVTATASDAKALATNANSQAAEAKFAADNFSVKLSGVEKSVTSAANQASAATSTANQANAAAGKAQSTANQANTNAGAAQSAAGKAQAAANSNAKQIDNVATTVSTVQTSLKATQTELSGKADKATVDATNNRLDDTNAQVKIIAGEVSSKAEQTTVTNLSNTVNNIKGSIDWKTVTGPFDANAYKTTQRIFYRDTQAKNTPNTGWFYFKVDAGASDRITQTLTRDNATDTWTRVWNGSWSAWTKQATGNDIANIQAQVTKQSTEISNNTTAINLKADKTETDTIKHTVQQQQAQQQIMADQIKTKVTSSDVQGILADGKYATQDYTQSIVNQTSQTLNSNITEVKRAADSNHQADVSRMTNLQQSIDGIQGVVKTKADQSTVTQLADAFQVKVAGTELVNIASLDLEWTQGVDNECHTLADFNASQIKKGTQLELSFDYMVDAKDKDCGFTVQLDNDPYMFWGNNYTNAVHGKKGHFTATVVAGDLSKSKAKHINIRSNWWKGTLHITNLTVTPKEELQSALNILSGDINLRVATKDLLSQINMEAGRTLIQSKKIFLDADSVAFSGKAFIPSAAITSLVADKVTTGWLNTNNVSLGDGSTRIWARSGSLYITGADQGDSYNMRVNGDSIEFVTREIPNNVQYMDGITPMYQISYDGGGKSRLKIRSFNKLTNSKEFPVDMYDSINISKDELDFAAGNSMKMLVEDAGVHVRPTLFFDNNTSGAFAGFTRGDNSDTVEFNTGNNSGENFHVNCGARFLQYVYINGYAKAQGWLTNSTLSKKTNIAELDTKVALDKIRQDKQYTYEYIQNLKKGENDPQASFIIDDVNAVSQYTPPREFIDRSGKYREPAVELSYLVAAVQELDKTVQQQAQTIQKLEEKTNE